jgi:nitroreductase
MIEPEKLLEFIKNRRSIRSFQDAPITEDAITMILEAARWTPSASNRQPWKFIVIKDKNLLEEIASKAIYGKFVKRAPLAIAIIGKKKISPNWYVVDTSLVSMNMMLMAWSLGIGTCWVGAMDREKAKKILKLNEDDYLLTILPFGYIKGAIPKPTLRKSMEEIKREL